MQKIYFVELNGMMKQKYGLAFPQFSRQILLSNDLFPISLMSKDDVEVLLFLFQTPGLDSS